MSEVRGVGLDLCEISRMEKQLKNEGFLRRVLTEGERQYVSSRGAVAASSLAALWAAKEACLKAFGVGLAIPLTDVEIVHEDGRPFYELHGEALNLLQGGRVDLSMTHEAGLAGAVCIWSV